MHTRTFTNNSILVSSLNVFDEHLRSMANIIVYRISDCFHRSANLHLVLAHESEYIEASFVGKLYVYTVIDTVAVKCSKKRRVSVIIQRNLKTPLQSLGRSREHNCFDISRIRI